MLTLRLITPDINLNKIICNWELNNSNNTYKIDTKILSESDENFGFLKRNKHQKLSTLQIKYSKNQINESAQTWKQLSKELIVSLSQINKIKRTDLSQLWSWRSSSLIKVYDRKKINCRIATIHWKY